MMPSLRASPPEEGRRNPCPCPARMRAASRVWTCSLHDIARRRARRSTQPRSPGAGEGVLVPGRGAGEVPALRATGVTRPAAPRRRRRCRRWAGATTGRGAQEWSLGSWAGGQLRGPDAQRFPRHKRYCGSVQSTEPGEGAGQPRGARFSILSVSATLLDAGHPWSWWGRKLKGPGYPQPPSALEVVAGQKSLHQKQALPEDSHSGMTAGPCKVPLAGWAPSPPQGQTEAEVSWLLKQQLPEVISSNPHSSSRDR
ncbi:uncharacterized protein LOC118676603 [Myotis myotis]|uniref:uncharacterized protein LOC118676603 n=1 Tax=Myotis myotis TaxID=51298 RepID=UPI00174DC999|nr:uncharacterized protein LOC118676603 [Myotis myotis]